MSKIKKRVIYLLAYLLIIAIISLLDFNIIRFHESDEYITQNGLKLLFNISPDSYSRTSNYFLLLIILPIFQIPMDFKRANPLRFLIPISLIYLSIKMISTPQRYFPAEFVNMKIGFYLFMIIVVLCSIVISVINKKRE